MKNSVIILAAGEGTRMKSSKSKVLHELCGVEMINHIIAKASAVSDDIFVVLGFQFDAVKTAIEARHAGVHIVRQDTVGFPGTAGAVRACLSNLKREKTLVICGDMPLVEVAELERLGESTADVTVSAFESANPFGYGRVITEGGKVVKIVEQKDASEAERAVNLCNAGAYAFDTALLRQIVPQIGNNNASREYYLTDAIEIAIKGGKNVDFALVSEENFMGVNDKAALSLAETGELEKSITLLESLGDYKDSTQQIKSLQYQLAKTFAKQGKYDQAIELYEALEDYEDSPAQLEETQKAKILKDIENYLTANYANKGGYDYDTYKCFEEYREHRYQNFTRAKAAIGMLDGDIPDSVKKLSSQISTAIGYYGKWKVVSGNTDLAYMDRVFPHNEVKYVDIALEYNKDGCFELYFLPNVIGATRVYKNGETFKISSNQKEPFEDKTDGKTITVIKNDRIVVRKYSDTKVIDKLILEKKS